MKTILSFIFITFVLACASPKSTQVQSSGMETEARDGSSFEKAIVVSSVRAEYDWIRKHYPESKLLGQALVTKNRNPYDVLTIITADGITKKIYFDIHKFYGKF